MAKDVRWEYVPAVFGGHWDRFARAYFAAQSLGVQEKTHDAVFKGIFVDRIGEDRLGRGTGRPVCAPGRGPGEIPGHHGQ